MALSSYNTQISGNTTLSGIYDTYIVSATGNTGFIITLPSITADGIIFRLTRVDVNPVIISITGPNVIYQNLGTQGIIGSATIFNGILSSQTTLVLQSYKSAWFIVQNESLQRTGAKTLFSTSFISNNSSIFYQIPGSVTSAICNFIYQGSSIETINQCDVVLQSGAGSPTGIIYIRDGTTGTVSGRIYGTGNYSLTNNDDTKCIFSITSFTNLPTTTTVLELSISVSGTNKNKVNVYSLMVR